AEALRKPLRDWMNGEQFWMIHAAGRGDFEATVEADGGFGMFLPANRDPERDQLEVVAEGRALRWQGHPGRLDRPQAVVLQPARPGASLRVDFKVNGEARKDLVFLGKEGRHPDALPATVSADLAPVSPFIERPFAAERPGFYVGRHRAEGTRPRPAVVQP